MQFRAQNISDDAWFEHNLEPKTSPIKLPGLPDPEIQMRFTGRAGRDNLEQAFDFYKFVRDQLPPDSGAQYRLIDFGGGWGRILRFFLREVPADHLALVDCLTDAIECAKSLDSPYAIFQNGTTPPLPFPPTSVDAIYAFSVFSHLSETACRQWLTHFADLLVRGGKVFVTTRGLSQIDGVRAIQNGSSFKRTIRKIIGRPENEHFKAVRTKLPSADTIISRYENGEIQFYPTGGGGELSEAFYGETWIPEQWMRNNFRSFGFDKYKFFQEFASIDQCVFILTKNGP